MSDIGNLIRDTALVPVPDSKVAHAAFMARMRPVPQSDFTLDEQANVLGYVTRLIRHCLGHSPTDTYRAYSRGAKILGFKLERHRGVFRDATLHGAQAAVRLHPNVIRRGELVGHVYFAVDSTGSLLKIGHSADPTRRIRSLELTTGKSLKEVARRDGFMLHELAYQIAARAAWAGGEWFDLPLLLEQPNWQWLAKEQA